MIGKWTGFYKHESQRISKKIREQKTKFDIEITSFTKNEFTGTIKEDPKSGGMNGVGKIKGYLKKQEIYFIKLMPTETQLLNENIVETNKKHPTLYYKGKCDQLNKRCKGKWKFKFGFTKVNGKIAIRLPIKGVWEMKKVENKW